MIDYNFQELISKYQNLYLDPIYKEISSNILPNSEKMIDMLWKSLTEIFNRHFDYDMTDILNALKTDILFSLYTTLHYTCDKGTDRPTIISILSETDSALKNENSAESAGQSLSHKKTNLKENYEPGNTKVLLSGQLFSNNATQYFQQFWQPADHPLHCFNITNFIYYMKASNFWPYSSQNMNGMSFGDYFKGIRIMGSQDREETIYSNNKIDNNFDDEFSYYVLEQLFAPVNFINNLQLHLTNFEDLFTKTTEPSRERSIVLLQPLFKLPNGLWELLAPEYITALKNYIADPKNIYKIASLKANIALAIYYQQDIIPFIKIVVGSILYTKMNYDMEGIMKSLKEYLTDHIESSQYHKQFNDHMNTVASLLYYNNKTPVDIMGNYYYKQNPSTKPPKGNDLKRNNQSILSYEINFTYQFFSMPDYQDYFTFRNQTGNSDWNFYLHNLIDTYWKNAKDIQSSITTYNYLRKQGMDKGLFPIMLE